MRGNLFNDAFIKLTGHKAGGPFMRLRTCGAKQAIEIAGVCDFNVNEQGHLRIRFGLPGIQFFVDGFKGVLIGHIIVSVSLFLRSLPDFILFCNGIPATNPGAFT